VLKENTVTPEQGKQQNQSVKAVSKVLTMTRLEKLLAKVALVENTAMPEQHKLPNLSVKVVLQGCFLMLVLA
jgi:hypothetical protein